MLKRTFMAILMLITFVLSSILAPLPSMAQIRPVHDKVGFEKLIETVIKPHSVGSYTLNISGAVRNVKWRDGDVTYIAYSDGTEFGWAYFKNRKYERSSIPSPALVNRTYVWYDRGPVDRYPVSVDTVYYPLSVVSKLSSSANYVFKISSNKSSSTWVLNGPVSLDNFTSPNERSTVVVNNKGYISSIKIGSRYRLTSNLSSPNPLVKSTDIESNFDK
ncbi:MAG: hypothetical protein ACKOW9_03505 [Candidatus Paceibacterota bacterium]